MTQFIGVSEMSKLVRKVGVLDFLRDLAGYIEEDFRRWPLFEKAARVASHSKVGVIELMPTSDGALYGFKYVNGHPGNTATGKLTVTGFGVLADVATGYPMLITEMTLLTALRTAATSAMAARALARRDSKVMAMIGAGAQSEFQVLAFKALLGIEEVRIYDPDRAAVQKFMANAQTFGLKVTRAETISEGVAGADIVTTATAVKGRAAVITPEMLSPGTHINAIGGDCPGKTELHADVLRMGKVFVEYPPQTRIEGEIQQVEPDFPVTELWQVLSGAAVGRAAKDEITIFDSVGFAVEDFSALRFVRDLTLARSTELDLIPEVANPKDLFGPLLRTAPARVVRPDTDRISA
jgi:ornithine cyclodeaminase